jgi:hypothetical protein
MQNLLLIASIASAMLAEPLFTHSAHFETHGCNITEIQSSPMVVFIAFTGEWITKEKIQKNTSNGFSISAKTKSDQEYINNIKASANSLLKHPVDITVDTEGWISHGGILIFSPSAKIMISPSKKTEASAAANASRR